MNKQSQLNAIEHEAEKLRRIIKIDEQIQRIADKLRLEGNEMVTLQKEKAKLESSTDHQS